jgi:hypothetical protein
MTEPRDLQRERLTTAAAADGEPEGIPDLDVPGDDADAVRGGLNVDGAAEESKNNAPSPIPIPYPL